MNVIDPRELGDRALLGYLLFGDLPRAWRGRGRALARRALLVAILTIAIIVGLVIAVAAILLIWASMQAPA